MSRNESLKTILKKYQEYVRLPNEYEGKFWKKIESHFRLTQCEVDFLKQWDPWSECFSYGNTGKMDIDDIECYIREIRNGENDEFSNW